MSNSDLASYLNDHLAGSVAALELLELMNASTLEPAFASFLKKLQAEIKADREELESLMRKLDLQPSTLRKWTAWFVEKASNYEKLKIRAADQRRQLEAYRRNAAKCALVSNRSS